MSIIEKIGQVWYYNIMKSDKKNKQNNSIMLTKDTGKNKDINSNKKDLLSRNEERFKKLVQSQIPLSNDVFMVFAKNKRFCQEFLRVILQDKKLTVIDNDIQKNLPSAFSKNIVLDMLCKLGNGDIVNVEIQLTYEKGHAKRIFTYASKIKSYLTEKGKKYKDLKDIIVIYLTKEDIFKKKSTVYEVEMNIVSDQKERISKWDAGLKVYYVNTKGLTNKNINEYLKLLTDKTTINRKYKETTSIKQEIFEIGGATMSKEMKTILDAIKAESKAEGIQQGKAEGRAEGRAEGMQQGRLEERMALLLNLVKDKLLSITEAAKRLGVSEKEFMRLAEA